MKALKTIGLVVVVALAAVLTAAAMQPDTFYIERSTVIAAAPDRVFDQINDLQRMRGWNPYERKDPALKGQLAAISSGLGASYSWESDTMGTGRMTIVEVTPNRRVSLRLDFVKPFAGTFTSDYVLRRDRGDTQVVWAMHGSANFIHKLMAATFILDPLIGKDLDSGLANLKTQVETY
jgi:uncharacterized protein YndB with AHSA1/START domain